MLNTTILQKEIENINEKHISDVLNYVLFLKNKQVDVSSQKQTSEGTFGIFNDLKQKSMFGAYPGINTEIEREEIDRI